MVIDIGGYGIFQFPIAEHIRRDRLVNQRRYVARLYVGSGMFCLLRHPLHIRIHHHLHKFLKSNFRLPL